MAVSTIAWVQHGQHGVLLGICKVRIDVDHHIRLVCRTEGQAIGGEL